MAIAGALTIAFSAILVKQAGVSPSTAAIFRCAYAVPVLGALAWWEDRPLGSAQRARPRARGAGRRLLLRRPHLLAPRHRGRRRRPGHGARQPAGRLRPAGGMAGARRAPGRAHPGHAAAGAQRRGAHLGVLEDGAYGADPTQGVLDGLATGPRLHRLHPRPARGQRRAAARRRAAVRRHARRRARVRWRPGLVIGDADLVPSWPAHAWLVILALSSQVLGWLLDLRLAAAPAGGPDLAPADDPAGGLGHPRRAALRRGAVGAAARGRRPDPGGPRHGRRACARRRPRGSSRGARASAAPGPLEGALALDEGQQRAAQAVDGASPTSARSSASMAADSAAARGARAVPSRSGAGACAGGRRGRGPAAGSRARPSRRPARSPPGGSRPASPPAVPRSASRRRPLGSRSRSRARVARAVSRTAAVSVCGQNCSTLTAERPGRAPREPPLLGDLLQRRLQYRPLASGPRARAAPWRA